MTENKEEKILYIGTCADDDPEKASMPFVMACAALAMDIKATIALQGTAVYLAQKGYVDKMPPGGGFPPMTELLANFMELGGELKVCVPCMKIRNIEESELVEGSKTTAAGALNIEAIEARAVMVY
ncbi:MAG: DsrE family protein [Desulfobacterales bacterium]